MHFCSLQYLLFFLVVFGAYWLMPWQRARVWLLLGASVFFYASWSQWLALLICVSTLLDYLIARGMEASASPRMRKLLLLTSLLANLGMLCFFKYVNFFLSSLGEALHAAGLSTSLPVLSVLAPIGISFYTFEAINYTVDVYRRRIPAERNLADFMLFILFFPHLIAGPIVRARDFLPQIGRRKHWDWARLHLGGQYFLMGFIKKVAIADRMALFAEPVFHDPAAYGTRATWMAVLAYALQVYCDFSGYSDMAIGTAHLFGYKLAQNFAMPYLSPNTGEFWRRWHISLSTWLRDYLFYPLGGSRGGTWKTNRNVLIVMTLCGLWHGANWPMVTFGVLQGLMLIVHRHFRDYCERRPRLSALLQTLPGTCLRIGLTFFTFCLTLAVFRSNSLADGATMLWRLLPHDGLVAPMRSHSLLLTLAIMGLCHWIGVRGSWKKWVVRLPAPALGFGYAVALTFAMVLIPDLSKTFIYFNF